jgi:hypothetical protein
VRFVAAKTDFDFDEVKHPKTFDRNSFVSRLSVFLTNLAEYPLFRCIDPPSTPTEAEMTGNLN